MSTESSTTPMPSQSDISADGDVILVVGSLQKRLRVQSAVMRVTSPYFKNMFGPHFAEGQNLNEKDPKEVLMLDDNATALEIICNVIHHRNDMVPSQLKPQQVFDLAVAADKFDCVRVLQFVSRAWLNTKGLDQIIDLGNLMAAAYLLDNAEAFSETTLTMVMRHEGSYLPLIKEVVGMSEIVPWETLYLLEECRSLLRIKIQQVFFIVSLGAGRSESSFCTCAWASQHHFAFTKLLHDRDLQPEKSRKLTIAQIKERLENMNNPVIARPWTPCDSRWHQQPTYRASLDRQLKPLLEGHGLCLDCVRPHAEGAKKNCRITHP